MLRYGTLFRHDDASTGYCVILGVADASGRYPVLLLEKADAGTPPELCIRVGENAPNAAFPADLRIDPYNCRRVPADALAQEAASGIVLPAAIMDRIFRAMGKAAARGHYEAVHAPAAFMPGVSPVPVSGKCWGPEEMESLTDASLDFWLTAGHFAEAFEKKFAQTVGCRHALAVNSGSSANLVALSTLCSPKLGDRRLKPGDEVITVAAGFPTTIAPIVQNGLVPVFVDAAPPTYNALPDIVEEAVGPRTRAIFMAHTLGNPFDLNRILETAHKHDLWLVEDSCDALGARFTLHGEKQARMCGTFGHLATYSFYPAHHITMGEGGAVVCDDPELYRIALSMRDWGRDCWCPPGRDDTCKKRYQWHFPKLPDGYDHKYVYSHLGYNLKVTDMQAAVGLRQLERLDGFVETRRRNFTQLREALAPLEGEVLTLPQATPGSQPSWFGFLITLKPQVDRTALLRHLNDKRIGTRLLFAGNILSQPCFDGVRHRQVGELRGTDEILNRTFWVGCFPGLMQAHMEYMAQTILDYFKK